MSDAIESFAYVMVEAYETTSSRPDAVKFCRGKIPPDEFDPHILESMWRAIDAWNDMNPREESDQLRAEVDRLREENQEWQQSFDLCHASEMRAIQMWHEAGGDELTWPDKGKMTIWLLERLQAAREALGIIKRSLDESVDRGINDNRMKHMLEILLTSEEYETVTAALNAELEKK